MSLNHPRPDELGNIYLGRCPLSIEKGGYTSQAYTIIAY